MNKIKSHEIYETAENFDRLFNKQLCCVICNDDNQTREYAIGDYLIIREHEDSPRLHPGHALLATITDISHMELINPPVCHILVNSVLLMNYREKETPHSRKPQHSRKPVNAVDSKEKEICVTTGVFQRILYSSKQSCLACTDKELSCDCKAGDTLIIRETIPTPNSDNRFGRRLPATVVNVAPVNYAGMSSNIVHIRNAKDSLNPGKVDAPKRCHKLKIDNDHLEEILAGTKRFEVRKDDRMPRYTCGDILLLQGYDRATEVYSGVAVTCIISSIYRGDLCKDGYCIMSIGDVRQVSGLSPATPPSEYE